ncbi:MAG: Uma2 family endonuclease [Microcystaceae cyanobacterium]
MIAIPIQPMSFEAFLDWYPEGNKRYELIEGVIIEMLPTGSHEIISGFLMAELNEEIRKQKLPYSLPKNCLLKPYAPSSGYIPDVAVIHKEYIKNEPLWEQSSVIQTGQTIPLIIEVVSTNWRNDYGHKFVEYEAMGIMEYWIVDYRALGAVRYIGKPKQPTITICQLIEGEYKMERFIKGDRLNSCIFPELNLTTDEIFQQV